MTIEEGIEFFKKFSYDSLESLDLIMPHDDAIMNCAYTSVSNSKFEEIRDEFEGMNEYDYITKIRNFSIPELNNKSKFNKKELAYLQNLLNNSKEENITSAKENNEKNYNDFNDEELESLFDKFNIYELDTLNMIFDYVHEYEIKEIRDALNKVHKEKESYDEVKVSDSNILNKINTLSKKEIKLLHKLIEDASFYLSSIQSTALEYQNAIEDFDINDYSIDKVNKLELELEKAKQKKRI